VFAAAAALVAPAAAPAAPAPSGAPKVPRRVALGGTVRARVPIVNRGARSRVTRVSVFASLDGKARGAVRVGEARVKALVSNSSPSGGDWGPAAFPVEAKTECDPLRATLSGRGSETHSEQCNPPPPEPSVTTSTDIRFTWSYTLGLEASVVPQESGTRVETTTVNGDMRTNTSPGPGYFGIERFTGDKPTPRGRKPTKWVIAASIGNGPPKRAEIPASALKKLPYTLSISASETVPQDLDPDCTGTPIEREWTGTVTIRR
jgi:hypothetical protein